MAQWMHTLIASVLWQLTWHLFLKKLPPMEEEINRMTKSMLDWWFTPNQ